MKKLILFCARDYVLGILIALMLCIFSYISVIMILSGISAETFLSTWIALLSGAVISILLIIIGHYTTSFTRESNKAVLIYDGDVVRLYQGPLWGKYFYRVMRFANDWGKAERDFSVRAELRIEAIGREVIFPFRLQFRASRKLSAETLDSIILMQGEPERRWFQFDACIRKIFSNANLRDEIVLEFENLAEGLFSSISNKAEILDIIEKKVHFPGLLFLGDVEISLLRKEIKSTLFDREESLNFV